MKYEANLALRRYGYFDDSDELMHYGISGQKWGIRRYQNKDGSLTEEGKRRYGFSDSNPTGNAYAVKKVQKDMNKLGKLTDKADIYKQEAEREKRYKKAARATALGTAAAVTAFSVDKYGRHPEREPIGYHSRNPFTQAVKTLQTGTPFKERVRRVNNTPIVGWAFLTSLAVSGGAYAVAAKNAMQGKMAEKLTTISGHYKAVKKRNEKYNRMLKKYEGTAYEDMVKEMSKKFQVRNDNV